MVQCTVSIRSLDGHRNVHRGEIASVVWTFESLDVDLIFHLERNDPPAAEDGDPPHSAHSRGASVLAVNPVHLRFEARMWRERERERESSFIGAKRGSGSPQDVVPARDEIAKSVKDHEHW